ncbi:BCO2 (predicted) [Pycnogonum litorale]
MNSFVKSESYKKNMEAQRIVVSEFGTSAHPDPCKNIFRRFMSHFTLDLPDNTNINLQQYGDGIYACTETPTMYRIDPETLETSDKVNVSKCTAVYTHTAHSHITSDGSTLNYGLGVGKSGPLYNLVKFPPGKGKETFNKASLIASIPSRWRLHPSYFHSFAITDNYVIFIEQCLTISIPKVFRMHFLKESFFSSLELYENEKVLFHIYDKSEGRLLDTKYSADQFFFFHTINAYEDSGHIILDIVCHQDLEIITSFFISEENGQNSVPMTSSIKRFVLPVNISRNNLDDDVGNLKYARAEYQLLPDSSVYCRPHEINLSGHGFELPQINYKAYNGKSYRFVYGIAKDMDNADSCVKLIKVNMMTEEIKLWSCDDMVPSEPIFVAHPQAEDEDEGVILSSLLSSENSNIVYLLILDAKEFTELAKIEFETVSNVPRDIHGIFYHKE